mmetsp:Transcript_60128/g.73652  ORF Transcript_60128/g.73652 Transcript_60128/m.73652 type:complete len:365 (+) Transcript_60128:22-1116(+)
MLHHGHHHHMYPFGMSRTQLSRIICTSALITGTFVWISVLTRIYLFEWTYESFINLPYDGQVLFLLFIPYKISYLRGIFTSPGIVEPKWYKKFPDIEKELIRQYKEVTKAQRDEATKNEATTTKGGNTITNIGGNGTTETDSLLDSNIELPESFSRPRRSHYSKDLKANILRYDHWCVWLNNCVGLYNYKFFVLTFFYVTILSYIIIFAIIVRMFIYPVDGLETYQSNLHGFSSLMNAFSLFVSTIGSLFFIAFGTVHISKHIQMIKKNLTSPEVHAFRYQRMLAMRFRIKWHNTHSFDFGSFKNAQLMMGQYPFLWLCPTKSFFSDNGYNFKVNIKNDQICDEFANKIKLAEIRPLTTEERGF